MAVYFQAYRLLEHWLLSESYHSIHSPAMFRFYSGVVLNDKGYPWMFKIEKSRDLMKRNQDHIDSVDFGSGTKMNSTRRSIKEIAYSSLTPARWSRLLNRFISDGQIKNVLELGTSLGINSLYISENPLVKVWTMEGNPLIAEKAQKLFQEHERENIELIIGNIDQQLYSTLRRINNLDLAFLDANHRYEPTLEYSKAIWSKIRPGGFLIADDINRSPEMRKAWEELKCLEGTCASIDLYRWGIICKGPSELKGHHIWNYGSLFKP